MSKLQSLHHRHCSVEQFCKAPPKDFHILLNQIRSVEVGLFDDEYQRQVLLHHSQAKILVLVLAIVELDVGG